MRQSWSDDRLDDLNRRVDDGFGQLRTEVQLLRTEMQAGDTQLRAEITQLRAEMNAGFDALHRTIIQVGGGLIGTLVVASAGIVATQL